MRSKLTGTDSPRDSAAPKIRPGPSSALRDEAADDEAFKRYVAEVSRQIAARSTRAPVDLGLGLGAAPVPRAEPAEHRPRRPPGWAVLVIAATAGAAGLHFFSFDRPGPQATPTPRTMAWAPPPPPTAPPVNLESTRAAQAPAVERTAPPPPASAPEPLVAAPPPAPPPASADQVREVQTRLRSLGLNPGPVDGVAGPATTNAIRRYEQAKGQDPSGIIDRDLLTRLRQEPDRTARAPKTAARPTR